MLSISANVSVSAESSSVHSHHPYYAKLTNLLLAECEVRTGGKLWTEFFPSFYGPSAKRLGHENKEGKNEDP